MGDQGNPWTISAGPDPSVGQAQDHAALMAKVMQPAPAPAPVQNSGPSPLSMLNPMRAVEKDPVLAWASGNKWQPIDPYITGQKPQQAQIGGNNNGQPFGSFTATGPYGDWNQ